MDPNALPVAVDAMGGDNAPSEIIKGAELALEAGIPVLVVGQPDALTGISDIPTKFASEVIGMGEDPASAVRKKKDSSLVRSAEAVRDGHAIAMVSAGNTGATMASALLKIGRIRGVSRPAIATPIPVLGRTKPNILLDSGANAECNPEWLVQFAEMGAVYARDRFSTPKPKIGLLSIGEEPGKGSSLAKEAFKLLSDQDWQKRCSGEFVGNVEGRDLMNPDIDVIVTDGFTGNVALKTLEGTAKSIVSSLLDAFSSTPEAAEGAKLLAPALLPLYERLDPESVGGAILLGIKGVAIVSHGSSGPKAIFNAISIAHELSADKHVQHLEEVIRR